MKRLIYISILVWLSHGVAEADNQPIFETEMVEAKLGETPPALASIDSSFSIQISPAKIYHFEEVPQKHEEALRVAEDFSPSQLANFQMKRKGFLSRAAQLLNFAGLSYGAGSIVQDKIKMVIAKGRGQLNPTENISWPSPSNLTIKERSQAIITGILRALDAKLWQQAALVTRAAEFGVMMNIAPYFLAAAGTKAFGGQISLGISLGYNSETKALVFEIPLEIERLRNGLPTVLSTGINMRAGFFINDTSQSPIQPKKGMVINPPVIPGWVQSTPDYFASGVTTSLGLPPSPFADIMGYQSSSNRVVLLRVAISPMQLGFIRFSSGAGRLVVQPILDFIRSLLPSQKTRTQGPLCRMIFSSAS